MANIEGQLTLVDIAAIAGVSRAAVSNWRSRHASFPQPIAERGRSPLFDAQEVLRWLAANTESNIAVFPGNKVTKESREIALKSALNTASFQAPNPIDLAAISLVLLVARLVLDDADWQNLRGLESAPELITEAARKVHAAYPEQDFSVTPPEIFSIENLEPLLELLTSIDEGESAEIADSLVEILFSRGGRGGLSALGNRASRSSQLLAEAALSSISAMEAVYDPACGTGDTLLRIGREVNGIQAVGNDIDSQVAAVAVLLGMVQGTHLEVSVGDSLANNTHPYFKACAVVCEPPFGMRGLEITAGDERWHGLDSHVERSGESAFLLDAVAHLAPGGRAYILAPLGTLDQGRWAKVRQHLVARGHVEAIVQLPPRLLTYTSIATALWVLTPEGESEQTALINASGVAAPEAQVRGWLENLREGEKLRVPHQIYSLSELVQRDMKLLPAEDTRTARFRIVTEDDDAQRDGMPRAGKLATLKELGRDDIVYVLRPYAQERLEAQEGYVLVNCGVNRYTARMAQPHEQIGTGSAFVRVDARVLLPEYVRECIDGTDISVPPGDGPAKFSPGDVVVPLLSLDEQRDVVERIGALREAEEEARRAAHEAVEKRKALMGVLRARL